MLSDESSSDSETGRFKCKSTNQEHKKSSHQREDNSKFSGRSRHLEEIRSRRDLDKQRNERERFGRHDRERHRHSRYSPVSRRRNSRERSPRRSHDRFRRRGNSRGRSKPTEYRSSSRDRHKKSDSRLQKLPEHTRNLKTEIQRNLCPKDEGKGRLLGKSERNSMEKKLTSPEPRAKKSEIHRPVQSAQSQKRKSESPILVDHSDDSNEVKPGSYYSMIPAIVKEKSDESSEIDSSDDEKLRAKLLNLEKELHKTRKKKHKKKHKRKSSKSSKDRDQDDTVTLVEVSSTTDIQENAEIDKQEIVSEPIEVSSTQKSNQKESESESGEISSDENSENDFEIDASDLRHKLKGSGSKKYTKDVCGPALPPHLKSRYGERSSNIEGPALPLHLKSRSKNIGPSIPDDLRKILAETDHGKIKHESSDEDVGIGPLPTGTEEKWSEAHKQLEERALNMKMKQLEGQSFNSEKLKNREQWMLELPESKTKFLGLEARNFRAKEGPDMSDRSSWTDTPDEKARKAAGIMKEEDPGLVLQREAKARQISSRDEEHESVVKKHKKKHKREESLLEMHQKKLKKKKKKDEKDDSKKERRPFSRDVDLQVNRFDEAQKKSIIKKAQDLNTRFSRGEAKFL